MVAIEAVKNGFIAQREEEEEEEEEGEGERGIDGGKPRCVHKREH